MNLASTHIDHAASSHREQQPAGSHEIPVETFEQRQQCSREDDVDDPARTHRLLEGHRRHELFADQRMPRSHKSHRSDDASIEKNADENSHPNRAKETPAAKLRAGFFRGFAHGFESGHEVRHDLDDQQNGNERSVREQRRESCAAIRG